MDATFLDKRACIYLKAWYWHLYIHAVIFIGHFWGVFTANVIVSTLSIFTMIHTS
jgi:hypothetical protein